MSHPIPDVWIDDLYKRTFNTEDSPDLDSPWTTADDHRINTQTDVLGELLLKQKVASQWKTFNQIVSQFANDKNFTCSNAIVADGISITDPNVIALPFFNPHVRILVHVTHTVKDKWEAYIVGSAEVESEERFLQALSWNGDGFNFYQRDLLNLSPLRLGVHTHGWTYQGHSLQAFAKETSYLGPFNGHVNGTPIMKELTNPWIHWASGSRNLMDCLSKKTLSNLKLAKWLVDSSGSLKIIDPFQLETIIESSTNKFARIRGKFSFLEADGKTPRANVEAQRWLAHLCLTTTINIGTPLPTTLGSGQMDIPPEFFFNTRLLQIAHVDFNVITPSFTINMTDYNTAAATLNLWLLQEVEKDDDVPAAMLIKLTPGRLGGGKQTNEHDQVLFAKMKAGEGGDGNGNFTFLTPSFEDFVGVATMMSFKNSPLISNKALGCLLAVDIPNPVYSWKRGVLLTYCPIQANLVNKVYDIEATWISAIEKSPRASQQGQIEYDFLQLYRKTEDEVAEELQHRFVTYVTNVQNRIQTAGPGSLAAVKDWLKLAESKRRIYRPLPLNEFGFTLPYALNDAGDAERELDMLEMTMEGTVVTMDCRGQCFFDQWTKTLWTTKPILIPEFEEGVCSKEFASILDASPAPIHPALLPQRAGTRPWRKAGLLASAKCPVIKQKIGSCPVKISTAVGSAVAASPTWETDIKPFFFEPYWVDEDESARRKVAAHWRRTMLFYGNKTETKPQKDFDLQTIDTVRENVVTIFQHLYSQSMPITDNSKELWPAEALETLRLWANQGCRLDASSEFKNSNLIPPVVSPLPKIKVRKDILSLTQGELDEYRARIDDRLQPGILGSKWQELCRLHGEWCLHYQEAFNFWHRAFLHYVEELIDHPLPYWNVCSLDCADPDSEAAGIPQAFWDDTYVHPTTGEVRPNPLKYALGLDGKSVGGGIYVTRDPVLTRQDRNSKEWKEMIAYMKMYYAQVSRALRAGTFSYPENVTTGEGRAFGVPWAQIPTFTKDEDPNQYVYENPVFPYVPNFDGFFEQVHDNYHGWIGGDMADNTTTGTEPIFLSFHANIDRIATTYLDAYPQSQFTARFPLQPFKNEVKDGNVSFATVLDYTEPLKWRYTTIGDLAKDTKALGYLYGPPKAGDGDACVAFMNERAPKGGRRPQASGGSAIRTSPNADLPKDSTAMFNLDPMIVFKNIKCTDESYTVDCFTKSDGQQGTWLGRFTRIGMGTRRHADGSATKTRFSKCRASGISRVLHLDHVEQAVVDEVAKNGFMQEVRELKTNKTVPEEEWKKWDGFSGVFAFGATRKD